MNRFADETAYKKAVRDLMEGQGFDVQFHEDAYVKFIPDTSFAVAGVDGWIEFKYHHKVPPSLGSIKHYTYGQENWLIKRGRAGGGRCWLLLGTPSMNYLWNWDVLKEIRNLPFSEVIKYALISEPTVGGLVRAMRRRCPSLRGRAGLAPTTTG